jgi:hypothetical protein
MVAACLVATTMNWNGKEPKYDETDLADTYDSMDGPSEEEAYLQGMLIIFIMFVSLRQFRRVQDHPSARWRAVLWETCKATCRSRYRSNAGRPEPPKSHLRVRLEFFLADDDVNF